MKYLLLLSVCFLNAQCLMAMDAATKEAELARLEDAYGYDDGSAFENFFDEKYLHLAYSSDAEDSSESEPVTHLAVIPEESQGESEEGIAENKPEPKKNSGIRAVIGKNVRQYLK